MTFPEILFPGTAFEIRCKVGNAGVAPPYRDAFLTYTLTDDRGGIVAVLSDETLNLRGLPVGAPDKTPLKTHVSRLQISARAPFLKPGLYSLWISVGRRDGTPEIRLPYDKVDARNRVFLGTVEVRKGAFGLLFVEGLSGVFDRRFFPQCERAAVIRADGRDLLCWRSLPSVSPGLFPGEADCRAFFRSLFLICILFSLYIPWESV